MFANSLLAFGVSAAVILLQLIQTRVFSVLFWNHLVYFIISIALLGFGISGTWLSLGQTKLANHFTRTRLAIYFLISSILTTLVLPCALPPIESAKSFQLLIYALAVLPYFFAGWMLGVLFKNHSKDINILYFADLVGAAIGCILYVMLIQSIGITGLVILTCCFVLFPCLLGLNSKQKIIVAAPYALVIGAILYFNQSIVIMPKTDKAMVTKYKNIEANVEFSQWNTISKIDVVSTVQNPSDKKIYIDGDAWTHIVDHPANPAPAFDESNDILMFNKAPYLLKKNIEHALVIGAGGGIDVWHALRGGAKQVDAIEINPTTRDIGLTHYRTFNNELFHREGVTLHNEEGRSFIHNSNKKYDLIMIHAIDTFAALNSGAYMLSENYLYTVDAFNDYISHLSSDGILCMTRWNHPGEATRLFTTSLESLYQLGIENPQSHILAIDAFDPEVTFVNWMTVLIQGQPFTSNDIEKISTYAQNHRSELMFPVQQPKNLIQTWTNQFAKAKTDHTEKEFFKQTSYDVRPTTDDSPFFFNYERWKGIQHAFSKQDINPLIKTNLTTFLLFLSTLLAVALFIFLPLRKLQMGQTEHLKSWTLYFVCLGISFIFVEIALMQRFALFLGHPARSLVLILGTLLFSAGIGSFFSKKLQPHLVPYFFVLFCMIAATSLFYPSVIHHFLGKSLSVRAAISILLVSPLGFLMGVPFPMGIEIVSRKNPSMVPWMWGINGGTTVLGSIMAIMIAIACNFTTVLLLAGAGYLVAFAVLYRIRK